MAPRLGTRCTPIRFDGLPLGITFPHMGQRFRDLGYRTAYTGKWHLDGHDYFGSGRCPDGWDDAT